MGLLDKLKDIAGKGEQLIAEHPDQIKDALDKAEKAVDKQTGGKFHDKIASAADKADEFVDKQAKGSPGTQSPPA